eukprot:4476960-Pyramimonas_sp.AAC.1
MATAAQQHGLHIHPDKTKILTNLTDRTGRARQHKVNSMEIEILPHCGSVKQQISFQDTMHAEVQRRIKAGWAAFTARKEEVTAKHYPLKHRLRLFEGTVTPT